MRTRRDLELDRARGRWQLDCRAERRFPRRKRKVDVDVRTVDPIQRVVVDADIEVEVAARPAAPAVAALARNAQPLPVGDSARNAQLDRMRDVTQHTLFVELGATEVELQLGAVKGRVERNANGGLVVASGSRFVAAARALAAGESCEQVAQVDVVERACTGGVGGAAVAASPVGRRTEFLALRVRAERVVGGALFRILECFIRLTDLL